MKALQNALAVVVLAVLGVAIFQYLRSQSLDRRVGYSEKNIEEIRDDSRAQRETLSAQGKELSAHGERLKAQAEEVAEVEKRLGAVEAKTADLSKSSETDRAEIARLKRAVEDLQGQAARAELKRREMEDFGQDLKKRLQRDIEFERRLLQIEKQLGIGRPEP